MHWRRTDPLQEVRAVIATGPAHVDRVAAAMSAKPALLRSLDVERGEDWIVIFAARLDGGTGEAEDWILPRLDGVTPLYEEAPGWWLPVGIDMEAPDHVRAGLRRSLSEHYGFAPPAILVPRLAGDAERAREADVYLIRNPAPFEAPARPGRAGPGGGVTTVALPAPEAVTEPASALPAVYAPFTLVFERLSQPLQRVLQGQLEQFERLARHVGSEELAAVGEFEGFGGLTNRGDIGQIVQSELLLRTEAPLEFLRRLAESETVFLEKQYADPGARSVYRAMISVGPGSLGHGRIVALAALFFMARIAHARHADFHWCFLPRCDGAIWFEEVSVNTVKRLLKAASYREMTADDLAEAAALWSSLEAGALPVRSGEPIDWVFGAAARRPVKAHGAPPLAVDDAANALCFSLLPPRRGEPRAAQLVLRAGGRDRTRASVLFPDERVCVSALNNPFRPLAPAQLPVPSAIEAPPASWAPEHFIIPAGNSKLVRMPDGLLILGFDHKHRIDSRWFAPLPDGVQLAGVRVHRNGMAMVVHTKRRGSGALAYGYFSLFRGHQPRLGLKRVVEIPAEHLFRKQAPLAIPPLDLGRAAGFYSTSGGLFELDFDGSGPGSGFAPQHKAPRVLFSTGVYQVVRGASGDKGVLRVLKNGGSCVDEFLEGPYPVPADHPLRMAYSRAERSLAWSPSANAWIVLSAAGGKQGGELDGDDPAENRLLTIERHETLLTARWRRGVLSARLWSDVRKGGDGTVRTVQRHNDKTTTRHSPLKLGADAAHIVKIELGDDGLWALTVNSDGEPAELLNYRLKKGVSEPPCARIDLRHEARAAVTLAMEQLHG